VKLVIAGEPTNTGRYFEEVKKLAAGDKRVIFTGPLFGAEKAEAFSNCRFFVLPSTTEGLPIVILEAMSFGKCALVSGIRENMDVVGRDGFQFRVRDVNGLASKMRMMLNNPELVDKKGLLGREKIISKYDWDSIARETLDVYKDVLEKKRGAR
jgi:glycosyltransferase involved in cell wall biosynthesis